VKRYSKDAIKAVERLGFEHVWTNSKGFYCYVHPGDPQQTELSISPSMNNEQAAKEIVRRAEKICGVAPQVEKRKASQVKERAEVARERLRIVRKRKACLLAAAVPAADLEWMERLEALRERELSDIERLMRQPPAGGRVHRGTGQARHYTGCY
jgi:hypothetical protein